MIPNSALGSVTPLDADRPDLGSAAVAHRFDDGYETLIDEEKVFDRTVDLVDDVAAHKWEELHVGTEPVECPRPEHAQELVVDRHGLVKGRQRPVSLCNRKLQCPGQHALALCEINRAIALDL